MFSLFSAISGKFSTSVITGTFFPVLVFLSLFIWIVEPVTPGLVQVPASFQALETQSMVLAITFMLALLTGVLSGLNHLLTRLYSSIPGAGWFHTTRLNRLRDLRDNLDQSAATATAAEVDDADDAINPILTVLADQYPSQGPASSTRLGNVFANREGYFKARYGMSHAVGWWRLVGVMDAGFAGMLDDSKASFDFMLNSSFLSLFVVASLLAYAARFGAEFWPLCWRVALFALISRLAYLSAVDRAKALGNLERAAIDLFRMPLLSKLGYKYDFRSIGDEKAVWQALEVSLFTPDRSDGPPYQPVLAAPTASTSAISGATSLAVLKSIKSFHSGRFPRVTVELAVSDPAGKAHSAVTITDALPPSWSYLANSAGTSSSSLVVTATSPFTATLHSIPAGTTVKITYRIQAWKAGNQ